MCPRLCVSVSLCASLFLSVCILYLCLSEFRRLHVCQQNTTPDSIYITHICNAHCRLKQGDVPKALEVYVQRSADPQFRYLRACVRVCLCAVCMCTCVFVCCVRLYKCACLCVCVCVWTGNEEEEVSNPSIPSLIAIMVQPDPESYTRGGYHTHTTGGEHHTHAYTHA